MTELNVAIIGNLPKWFAVVYFIPFIFVLAIGISSYEIDDSAAARQETATGRIIGWSWNHGGVLHYAFEVNGKDFRDTYSSVNPLRDSKFNTVYYERSYPNRNSAIPFARLAEKDLRFEAEFVPLSFLMGVVGTVQFLRRRAAKSN